MKLGQIMQHGYYNPNNAILRDDHPPRA